MNKRKIFRHGVLVGSVMAGGILLSGCSDDAETAGLRVIHASPDAPAVNVRLGSVTEISNLDYAQSSGYEVISSGRQDVAVEAIIPGGNADVITVPDFLFDQNGRYTIIIFPQ